MAFKMNFFRSLPMVLASACLSLAACKTIETPNGELPDEALPYAEQVIGTYQNRNDFSTITITLAGKRLLATHHAKNNLDVLDSQCETEIGALREISADKDAKKIRGVFDFYRNYCTPTLEGKTITLQVSDAYNSKTDKTEKMLKLTYLMEEKQEQKCSYEFPSGQPPKQVCTIQTTPVYFQKSFVRQ